eukprot:g1475.t1
MNEWNANSGFAIDDIASVLTPVFIGLPLLIYAVKSHVRPAKTVGLFIIWLVHVGIYLYTCWSATPVEFAREWTLTIALYSLSVFCFIVMILLTLSFLIWGMWRLLHVSGWIPAWFPTPPSTNDLRDSLSAACSHAAIHMRTHPFLRRALFRNKNLRTHSEKEIGWLLNRTPKAIDRTKRFHEIFDALPPPRPPFELSLRMSGFQKLPDRLADDLRWTDLTFLLIPGLFTKSYPGYMRALRSDLQRLGLHVIYDLNDAENLSAFDTDKSVLHNAKALREEVLRVGGRRRIVAIGHSKGAVDFAAALSLYPEIRQHVACHISIQGPHGGTPLINDLWQTSVQKDFALIGLDVLGAGPEALMDMTYECRRAFYEKHEYPWKDVRTVCVASRDDRVFLGSCSLGQGPILLKPAIEYIKLRYEKACDGCVCVDDAILPGSLVVRLNNMDHFGPAYRSFPASDPYDPARLCLALTALALEKKKATQSKKKR